MGCLGKQTKEQGRAHQPGAAPVGQASRARLSPLLAALFLSACSGENPVATPVGWWHNLQGGAIASNRPPPPGADLPYPKLGTIPAKPVLPSASVRQTLQTQLSAQRDDTERLAARTPIDTSAIPPPQPAKPARSPTAPTAPADPAAEGAASATMSAADAPPPPPAASAPAPAPLHIVGAPIDEPNLPAIPDAPPDGPKFTAIPTGTAASSKAPTPPAHVQPPPKGTIVLFATNGATLPPSQMPTIHDLVNTRGKGTLAIEGHGEAIADTPGAQQSALELGVQRAQSIAAAFGKLHVPPEKITLGATAFGRDAAVRLIP
jgi:outer membrane protein OmpA-like peptidoglycan-associated protein